MRMFTMRTCVRMAHMPCRVLTERSVKLHTMYQLSRFPSGARECAIYEHVCALRTTGRRARYVLNALYVTIPARVRTWDSPYPYRDYLRHRMATVRRSIPR